MLIQPSAKILVAFRVENDFPFSKNSIAQIYESGLIGGKGLAIIPAFDNAPLAEDRDTLQTSIAPGLTDLVNEKLSPLQEKIESMIVHADSVLIAFTKVLDLERQEALRQSIDQFSETTVALTSLVKTCQLRKVAHGLQPRIIRSPSAKPRRGSPNRPPPETPPGLINLIEERGGNPG